MYWILTIPTLLYALCALIRVTFSAFVSCITYISISIILKGFNVSFRLGRHPDPKTFTQCASYLYGSVLCK